MNTLNLRTCHAAVILHYAEYFAGTNLSLNSSTYYALLADTQTQTPGQHVFSVGYTRSLGSQEAITLTLSGTLSGMFTASRSDQGYAVVTSRTLPPGRYSFDVIAVLTVAAGTPSLVTAAALVEVFSQSELCVTNACSDYRKRVNYNSAIYLCVMAEANYRLQLSNSTLTCT